MELCGIRVARNTAATNVSVYCIFWDTAAVQIYRRWIPYSYEMHVDYVYLPTQAMLTY